MTRFLSILLLFGCLQYVRSFDFKVEGQPGQCDPISFTWTGGQTPFRLIVVVPGRVNINMSIPDSNFKDNKGTFSIDALEVARGNQTFFMMSDATGPVSGGTSSLMTVGDSTSGKNCNTTEPAVDFFFSADGSLTQCTTFPFTQYDGAVKPLTIFAHIPDSHDSFVLPFSPSDATSFNWKANITAQTEVVFSIIDSKGRIGGTDIMRRVAPSSDSTCLLSTGGGGTGTGDGSSNNQDDKEGQKLLSVGAIAGIAVGGAVIACILIGIVWCIMRRRSKSKRPRALDLSDDFTHNAQTSHTNLPNSYAPVPYSAGPGPAVFVAPGASASTASFRPDHLGPSTPSASLSATSPPQSQYDDGPTSSSGQGTSSSRRFIVHRDIDEGDAPIDLPPQYSDRRNPIPGLAETSSPPAFGGRTKKG
ncbi:hypothetical protein AAF712_009652 [Marasmius tenuissimus]|uniref:Uncharacterized protein n=1 Tax=Marasmius tenuissimus TaxID=585030 RepID=A0ABR2ZQ09_9AGAR|nr:hypothetical protein PM082_015560 [Marasmius tenuissimus]